MTRRLTYGRKLFRGSVLVAQLRMAREVEALASGRNVRVMEAMVTAVLGVYLVLEDDFSWSRSPTTRNCREDAFYGDEMKYSKCVGLLTIRALLNLALPRYPVKNGFESAQSAPE